MECQGGRGAQGIHWLMLCLIISNETTSANAADVLISKAMRDDSQNIGRVDAADLVTAKIDALIALSI